MAFLYFHTANYFASFSDILDVISANFSFEQRASKENSIVFEVAAGRAMFRISLAGKFANHIALRDCELVMVNRRRL